MTLLALTAAALVASAASAQTPAPSPEPGRWTRLALAKKPLYATLATSKGDIVVKLYSAEAPRTVANFVALASGEREWTHPFTGEKGRRPLYDGVVFHRVIPGFMVQTGDPTGTGRGGPGYRFEDEVRTGRRFDRPGLLGMANHGPDTNGSQFFITVSERPLSHLDGKHTIFGEVLIGYDVAEAIAKVPTDRQNRPVGEDVTIRTITLSERPPKGLSPPPLPGPKKTTAPAPRPADAPTQ